MQSQSCHKFIYFHVATAGLWVNNNNNSKKYLSDGQKKLGNPLENSSIFASFSTVHIDFPFSIFCVPVIA